MKYIKDIRGKVKKIKKQKVKRIRMGEKKSLNGSAKKLIHKILKNKKT